MTITLDTINKMVNGVTGSTAMDLEKTKDTNKIIAGDATTTAVACCSSTKNNLATYPVASKLPHRANASSLRTMLPLLLCLLSFATVLSILTVFMDTTQFRHQQFRLNMSRDTIIDVEQDNPALIKFVREFHLKKHHMKFMNSNNALSHFNTIERHEMVPIIAKTVVNLLDAKENGVFFQSLTGESSSLLTAPMLADRFGWGGVIAEPESTKYFSLCKENSFRPKVQIVQACLSTNEHPKEITLHHGNDESEVRINSLVNGEPLYINSRVKCYPLYTMMLAVNETNIDLLSLGCQGQELEILETIPFQKVNIKIISIHLDDYYSNIDSVSSINYSKNDDYQKKFTRFLESKSYRLVKKLGRNFIFQSIKSIYKKTKITTKILPETMASTVTLTSSSSSSSSASPSASGKSSIIFQ